MGNKAYEALKSNQKINKLYNTVYEKLEDQGKKFEIYVLNEKSNSPGETINNNDKIEIIIYDNGLQYDKFIAIFIHELGEAHYIASNLPNIEYDSYEFISFYLYEIFTHYYINKLVKRFDLEEEVEPIQNNYNKISPSCEKWKDVVLYTHKFITWENRESFSEDKKYNQYISDIICILDKIDFFDIDIKFVEKMYKEILLILVDLGAPSNVRLKSKKDIKS